MNFGFPIPEEYDNDDFEENEESEIPKKYQFMQAFKITPNGPVPVDPNSIKKMMGKPSKKLCSIFDSEYSIYLINNIDTGDGMRLILECEPNSSFVGIHTKSIMDVYDYLNKTHFLNLLVAKFFDCTIWDYSGIDIQIQIVKSDKNKSYSKIMIMIETNDCEDAISDIIMHDSHRSKTMTMITKYQRFQLWLEL